MKSSEKPNTPSGMRDFGPLEMAKRNFIIDNIRTVFKNYGYDNIETPAMEKLSVLTGKYGDEGDQLLFKVLNSADFLSKTEKSDLEKGYKHLLPKIAEKGLKYDLTVPFARYVVMNRHNLTFPFKRFQIQPVWRADKPQRGRYREFYQCDADVVGSDSLLQEAEILLMIRDAYSVLGLKDYVTKVNNRKILTGISEAIGMEGKESEFCVIIDKLDKIGKEKVFDQLAAKGCAESSFSALNEMLDTPFQDQIPFLKSFLKNSESGMRGIEEIEEVFEYLKEEKDLQIEFDLTLARGLSYYTGAIFEVKPIDSKIGSINGGGRYDNLTGVFGLKDTSGIGISFGIDRIYDVLEEKSLFPSSLTNSVEVMMISFDKQSQVHALRIAGKLRKNNISCYVYPDLVKVKKQFAYADKNNIPHVIVIGSEEMNTGKYNLKNMQTGNQELLTIDAVIKTLHQ
ncbi:MAG: histidine--tRNA ligase [Cyclobacteriaceae bacterium]